MHIIYCVLTHIITIHPASTGCLERHFGEEPIAFGGPEILLVIYSTDMDESSECTADPYLEMDPPCSYSKHPTFDLQALCYCTVSKVLNAFYCWLETQIKPSVLNDKTV